MIETEQFTIGTGAACEDGPCGELRRVVVDPVARTLTHLVIGPADGSEPARLVPVDLVESGAQTGIRLRCPLARFETFEPAEETRFLPGASGAWNYRPEDMLSWPFYGLGLGGALLGGEGAVAAGHGAIDPAPQLGAAPQEVAFERVPVGEVQVRRGEHVHAKDGDLGRVQGLVVDPRDHHVTHVLLDEGHLWALARVAIPIKFVTGVEDGVSLDLTKAEVRDLPQVDLSDDGSN
jgi:hypothetical protein